MSLIEEARAEMRGMGSECWASAQDAELIADIQEAFDAGIQAAAIARALVKRGVQVTGNTLRRHFVRRECQCPR